MRRAPVGERGDISKGRKWSGDLRLAGSERQHVTPGLPVIVSVASALSATLDGSVASSISRRSIASTAYVAARETGRLRRRESFSRHQPDRDAMRTRFL